VIFAVRFWGDCETKVIAAKEGAEREERQIIRMKKGSDVNFFLFIIRVSPQQARIFFFKR